MKKGIFCAIATLLMCFGVSHAGSVTSLKQMVSGETAKAADVNGNFDALKTAVNESDAEIKAHINNAAVHSTGGGAAGFYLYSADNVKLGKFFGLGGTYTVGDHPVFYIDELNAVAGLCYDGIIGCTSNTIYFTGNGCTGDAYTASNIYPFFNTVDVTKSTAGNYSYWITESAGDLTFTSNSYYVQRGFVLEEGCYNTAGGTAKATVKLKPTTLPFASPVALPLSVR